MADDDPNSNPVANNAPSSGSPTDKSRPTIDPNAPDPVKMAEELGRLKKVEEEFSIYKGQVDPVIQTIWSDTETLKKVTDTHNKRLGVTPEDDKPIDINPPVLSIEKDTRQALTGEKITRFYERHGIDKLDDETKKTVNEKVSVILKEMLDPMGNKKSLTEVIDDVPLASLDKHLDNAYFLATKDVQLEEAKLRGKQEATQEASGIIGSMPSSSITPDNTILTIAQKKVADSMGIPHDKYLARVKEIESRNNQIY